MPGKVSAPANSPDDAQLQVQRSPCPTRPKTVWPSRVASWNSRGLPLPFRRRPSSRTMSLGVNLGVVGHMNWIRNRPGVDPEPAGVEVGRVQMQFRGRPQANPASLCSRPGAGWIRGRFGIDPGSARGRYEPDVTSENYDGPYDPSGRLPRALSRGMPTRIRSSDDALYNLSGMSETGTWSHCGYLA